MCTKLLRFSLLLGVFCTCLFAGAQTKIDDITQGNLKFAIYDDLTAQITGYAGE